ncbi:ABC transporter ATP-binding protein [Magnetovibrio sp. PR-2]|uniref:ABC transporter ATP-binding protein n=1 Tax=Magnetovibrio sp. PR-2 TaxID=3120356 RepID=UPI002FCE2779
MPDNAVEIRGLSKTYAASGKQTEMHALKGLDLDIPRGSFFGLLGPNGAGKSTLINILAGLVLKSSGTVRIWDYDITDAPRRAKRSIGIVPQELNIDPYFSPREALEVQAGLYGVPKSQRRTEEILEAVGLMDKADAYARRLSGGMRRRLLVAKALVHTPPVLVLDEPTAGVDVELRRQLWDYVRRLNEDGTTVLLTTHYLEEAEELCDRIAIINHGQVIACDETKNLMGKLDSKCVNVMLTDDLDDIPDPLAALGAQLIGPRELQFTYQPSHTQTSDIISAVQDAGLTFAELTTKEPELEDIFVQLTSQPDQDRA